ncbi:hypothetical protein QYE76_023859 [Lolium multiflorum]|uniref:Beta-galactosidase n=1 Tax=Lolium multiflorum TaxID=4521 RepID=A0AAD8RDR3_LOLMU|nr:hypothetical protein QYE76_023859 [Lolium multiflorum]
MRTSTSIARAALALTVLVLSAVCSFPGASCTKVSYDDRALVIDGERRIILSGSIHYPRSTPEMWPDLIQKAKDGGLNTIETYVFWNGHEPRPREYNFAGNYDIIRFFSEVQKAGMYAILRIGPYICGEWNYGGLPAWLRDIPDMQFRLHNQPFEREMETFTKLIVNKMKDANMFAGQGGPIILAQIENEYGNIQSGLPDQQSATKYIHWCAEMANNQNVGVPWIMCQQSNDLPPNVLETCNGFYCHNFKPKENMPKIWTENWTGWFKAWDKPDYHRPAEDLAYSVAMFFQNRGSVQNYYMYHGGTNFGRTTGGPYITTSYDYDAPLDEYGNIRQPKYGHLKQLHAMLTSMEKHLVYGQQNETSFDDKVKATKYTLDDGSSACFISNSHDNEDLNVTFEGSTYQVPAWSVSVLPDCKTVAYNTAKVKTQTSVMVKKESAVTQGLKWFWLPELLKPFCTDRSGSFRRNELLEQIVTGADKSDYLWYKTSLTSGAEEEFTLYVNTTGHELYAFVNGELAGYQHSVNGPYIFQFQAPVTMRAGKNYISLLSATVGLKNYGASFELMPAGIVGGPVKLVRPDSSAIDLSHSTWTYETGLYGESIQIHLDKPNLEWSCHPAVPVNRPFSWYKALFHTPDGEDAVVVDLAGLNKGVVYVNGRNLGRYWPSYIAGNMDGCHRCDYRGAYKTWDNQEKCLTGCHEIGQQFYHVPRSFLNAGGLNTIVLFEEAGGDPTKVNFRTVVVGSVCINAEKGDAITLACANGGTISSIDVTSFGVAKGQCGAYEGGYESKPAMEVLSAACLGKESCTVHYTDELDSAGSEGSSVLTVQATC